MFPTVNCKNLSVLVNFGQLADGTPVCPLPFSCHMLNSAAKADTEANPNKKPRADAKFELLVPVALPEEGGYDWVDTFLQGKEGKGYQELSERVFVDWVEQSGVRAAPGRPHEREDLNLGFPTLDDRSCIRTLRHLAGGAPCRSYVSMDLRQNLTKSDRESLLQLFPSDRFSRVARVMIGDPPRDVKDKHRKMLIAEKEKRRENGWRAKLISWEAQKKKLETAMQLKAAQKEAMKAARKAERIRTAELLAKKKAELAKAAEAAGEAAKAEQENGAGENGDVKTEVKNEEEVPPQEATKM